MEKKKGSTKRVHEILSNVSGMLGDLDLDITVNGYQFKRDKKNKMLLSMQDDGIRTNIHFSDSGFSFEQIKTDGSVKADHKDEA